MYYWLIGSSCNYIARLFIPDALGRGATLEYTKCIKMVLLK